MATNELQPRTREKLQTTVLHLHTNLINSFRPHRQEKYVYISEFPTVSAVTGAQWAPE